VKWNRTACFAAVLSTIGCASLTGAAPVAAAESVSQETAREAIENAKAAVKTTDQVGYLWRNTEELLKEAEKAFAKGHNAVAVEDADSAKFQAEAGYEQYLRQRDAKAPF
jgi:acyl-coenzyme A synthetase/AMP-(fatty) acid ligase